VVVIHIFSSAAGIQSDHEHHGAPVSIRVAIINHQSSQKSFSTQFLASTIGVLSMEWRTSGIEQRAVHNGHFVGSFISVSLRSLGFHHSLGESSSPSWWLSIATMLCQSHSCRSWHCNYMQHATTIISLEMRSTTTLQLDHLILTTVLIAFTLPFPLALTAMTTPPHSCDHFGTAHLVDFFFVAEEVW